MKPFQKHYKGEGSTFPASFSRGDFSMTEKFSVPAEETETTINYSQFQLGDWAELYTTDKNMMKRYEKFASNNPDYCRLIKEDSYSMTFSVHPKCVGIYPRAPRRVQYSEEQINASRERLRKYYEDKKANS